MHNCLYYHCHPAFGKVLLVAALLSFVSCCCLLERSCNLSECLSVVDCRWGFKNFYGKEILKNNFYRAGLSSSFDFAHSIKKIETGQRQMCLTIALMEIVVVYSVTGISMSISSFLSLHSIFTGIPPVTVCIIVLSKPVAYK